MSVHTKTWCTSDIKDTIFLICYPFLMTETPFQNKQPKTETQALFNCATHVCTLDPDHTSMMVSYLYLFLPGPCYTVNCLEYIHIK